mmetsp:Transcript_21878/g.32531  ORF Transcript_21878/g.32531 Transcript_21878/m.32531 type:complete len:348 (-) Transcript_21878:95-1138(-)
MTEKRKNKEQQRQQRRKDEGKCSSQMLVQKECSSNRRKGTNKKGNRKSHKHKYSTNCKAQTLIAFEKEFFNKCTDPPSTALYLTSTTVSEISHFNRQVTDKDCVNRSSATTSNNDKLLKKRYTALQLHPLDIISIYQIEINADVMGMIFESLAYLVTMYNSSSSLSLVDSDVDCSSKSNSNSRGEQQSKKNKEIEIDGKINTMQSDTFLNMLAPLFRCNSGTNSDSVSHDDGNHNNNVEQERNASILQLFWLFLYQWMYAMSQCGRFDLNIMFLSTQQKKAAEMILSFLECHHSVYQLDQEMDNTVAINDDDCRGETWWKKYLCYSSDKMQSNGKQDVEILKRLYQF